MTLFNLSIFWFLITLPQALPTSFYCHQNFLLWVTTDLLYDTNLNRDKLDRKFISAQVGDMETPTDENENTDGSHERADGNLNECQKIDELEKVLESPTPPPGGGG